MFLKELKKLEIEIKWENNYMVGRQSRLRVMWKVIEMGLNFVLNIIGKF